MKNHFGLIFYYIKNLPKIIYLLLYIEYLYAKIAVIQIIHLLFTDD
jgi:hypothetical protein